MTEKEPQYQVWIPGLGKFQFFTLEGAQQWLANEIELGRDYATAVIEPIGDLHSSLRGHGNP